MVYYISTACFIDCGSDAEGIAREMEKNRAVIDYRGRGGSVDPAAV